MRNAEACKPRAALFADVALHGSDLHRVPHEVGRPDARRHDVVCDNLHGVQRPELAAVHAVAPSGVVLSVGVRLHGKNGKKAARQKQKLRQKAHAARPVAAGKGHAVCIGKNGDRGSQQQNQRPVVAQAAGDRHGVEPGHGKVRDPEHEAKAQARKNRRHAHAVVDGEHEGRDGGTVEPLFAAKQDHQHKDQAGRSRKHNLEPHRRCICAFPAGICDAECCRSRHDQSAQPDKKALAADIIRHSFFHSFIIPSGGRKCKGASRVRRVCRNSDAPKCFFVQSSIKSVPPTRIARPRADFFESFS